nr:MAG: hypothetical protein 1 [Marnaviridae sp.]
MINRFQSLNLNTVNTCVCSNNPNEGTRICNFCELRNRLPRSTRRGLRELPLRNIEVIESPEEEAPVLYTFKARTLREVFFRMQEMFPLQHVVLYWGWMQLDPTRSFEYYRLSGDVQLIMELIEVIGCRPRPPSSSDEEGSDSEELTSPQLQASKSFETILTKVEEYEPFVKLIEDICCLIFQLKNARNIDEASIAVGCFIRSATGRANVYFYKDLCERFVSDFKIMFGLQSGGHWTNTLSDFYDNYSRCKNSEFGNRLKTFFNHLIMHCVYHKLGIEVDTEIFDKLEKKKIRPSLTNCLTFMDACASLLVFLLKQGRQAMLTGDVEHFFIDSDSLSAWTMKAKKLKMQSEFLSNPSAVGMDIHTYISDLAQTIEESNQLTKYMKISTPEGKFFLGMQYELKAIENRYLSVTAAQSMRKAPLAFVIYGDSGIAKSALMAAMSDFDARRRGRPTGKGFIFTINAETEYYENFKSNMHTIIIDDAAIHNPAKIQGVDPTISDVMRICNMIPWCPPQAAIEDKGKTPMLCNLCMISTNVHDVNIPIYYRASYAAMRRLKYRIEPKVRPEFAAADGISLDPKKAPQTSTYDDFWSYEVAIATRTTNMCGEYRHCLSIPNMKYLLKWLGEVSDQHDEEQTRALKNCSGYDITICSGCSNPTDYCLCETMNLQVRSIREEEPVFVHTSNVRIDRSEAEERFLQQFFQRNGNLDLFRSVTRNTKPWRDGSSDPKVVRVYVPQMSFTFKERLNNKCEEIYLDYYAFMELPFLLREGWSDSDILHDFYNFSIYVQEHTNVNDVLNISQVFTEQNITIQSGGVIGGFVDAIFKMIVSFYFYSGMFRNTCRFIGKYDFVHNMAVRFLRPCLLRSENQQYFVRRLGQQVDTSLGGGSVYIKCAIAFLSVGSLGAVAYGFWSKARKVSEGRTTVNVSDSESGISDDVAAELSEFGYIGDHRESQYCEEPRPDPPQEVGPQIQALRDFGSYPKKAPRDDKVNMWTVEDRAVTTVDFVPELCRDLVGFERKLCKNTLVFETYEPRDVGAWKYTGILTVLSNEHFLTNSHSIPLDIDCHFIVYLGRNHLVSPKVEFTVKQSQIERISDRDIAIVRTRNLPALFNDISRNFVKASYNGVYDGFYLIKDIDGSVVKHEVYNIKKTHLTRSIQGKFFDMEVFKGKVSTPTKVGDCGAPLVALTGYGPVIVGFHAIFDLPDNVYAAKFSYEDFQHFASEMQVQVGRIPIGDIEVYKAPKSYIDFHDSGNLMYHGELKTFRTRPHHNVVSSELASQIYGRTLNGVLLEERLYGPVMDSWRAQQTGLKEFLQPVKDMDETLLIEISEVWVNHILTSLPPEELELISPCCLDAAVNGVPGMAYVDSIKRSTSMGFPYYKTKKAFLINLEDDLWPDGVQFTPEVEQKIAEWMDLLREGIRLHAVFSANLKDEAVSLKKLQAWKTRIFFSCPAELLVIVRMFYLGFARVVQRNRELFWVAIGLNTTSPEWDDLFHILSKFGIDTTIAGDHVFYDKKVKMLIMYYVMDAINKVCFASGQFSDEMKLMMEVLKYELMNPTVDFFGMLITLLGGEVSGHQLTTIFNCILNIFYLMYAYKKAGYDLKDFFDNVIGVILGDDHVLCVSPNRPLYHHTHIKDVLEGLGLGYTMADKDSESRPYISLYEAPFLKRTFHYDVHLGVHVGRLEFNSIVKMITVQVRSKTVMLSTQLAQAICSATSEMFFYGEEAFNEFNSFINSLNKSESLKQQMLEYPVLSYDGYKRRFWSSTKCEAFDTGLQSQKCHLPVSYCSRQSSVLESQERMGLEVYNHARAFPEIRIHESMELDTPENCKVEENKLTPQHENKRLSKTNEQMNAIQSEIPVTEGSESSTSQQTQFINETVPEQMMLGTPHDSTAMSLVTQSHLGEFLSRPTKIQSVVWTENASAGNYASFNPWNLFFNNSNIRNKLEGFGFLRCKLHLKFTINASQFYYGSIGAFYTPMAGYIQETTGVTLAYVPGIQVLQSQKPHVWLDPQTTSTAEMELPFLYHKHFLDTTKLNDLTNMGKIDLTQYAALRSANGVTTTGVNIVVYAWATDVELSGLTAKAVLQSKREYIGNGQISGPASTVATVASRMNDIPVIGTFAKATEMVAGTVGKVASMFGYTNVPNIRDVEPVKPSCFHTLASSEISEPINKLSLQPKQEIAMGSSYAGDPTADQLHISNFCQRESFLCGALWTTTAAEDSVVFTSYVTPQLYEKSSGTNYSVHCTPMAYAAALFNVWRGDLIFRFKVIKTQYHRGRLSISWDPLQTDMANMPGYGNPRIQNIIFDLEDTDTIEVRVPYMQEAAFTQLRDGGGAYNGPWWSNGSSPTLTDSERRCNGTIQVRVVNRLTAPEASSDVDILVFVRAADNIEFAVPSEIRNKTHMILQSKKEFVMGTASKSDPMTYSENYGEKISSFRQLLHRQSKSCTQVIPRTADWAGTMLYAYFPFQRTPKPYGYTPNGSEVANGTLVPGSTFPFNYVRVHPISWLQTCFVGTKGSTNWTFNVINNNGKTTVPIMSASVCRTVEQGNNKPNYTAILGTLGTNTLMREHNLMGSRERQGAQGMALTNQWTQSGLSVNLPYYSRFKFQINNNYWSYSTTDDKFDDQYKDWYELTIKRGIDVNTTDANILIDTYVGTGPDFDFVFFVNCPYFINLTAPTALATG